MTENSISKSLNLNILHFLTCKYNFILINFAKYTFTIAAKLGIIIKK